MSAIFSLGSGGTGGAIRNSTEAGVETVGIVETTSSEELVELSIKSSPLKLESNKSTSSDWVVETGCEAVAESGVAPVVANVDAAGNGSAGNGSNGSERWILSRCENAEDAAGLPSRVAESKAFGDTKENEENEVCALAGGTVCAVDAAMF